MVNRGRPNLWVVVANHADAQIYEVHGLGKDIHKIQEFHSPNARKKASEILSDRPGRSFESVGPTRHPMGRGFEPHLQEMKDFVAHIADILYKAKMENTFDRLALLASPQVLGEIRLKLSNEVQKCIIKEVAKDLPPSINENERINQMCELLDLWNHKSAVGGKGR